MGPEIERPDGEEREVGAHHHRRGGQLAGRKDHEERIGHRGQGGEEPEQDVTAERGIGENRPDTAPARRNVRGRRAGAPDFPQSGDQEGRGCQRGGGADKQEGDVARERRAIGAERLAGAKTGDYCQHPAKQVALKDESSPLVRRHRPGHGIERRKLREAGGKAVGRVADEKRP